jgi:hypothetical protein
MIVMTFYIDLEVVGRAELLEYLLQRSTLNLRYLECAAAHAELSYERRPVILLLIDVKIQLFGVRANANVEDGQPFVFNPIRQACTCALRKRWICFDRDNAKPFAQVIQAVAAAMHSDVED